MAIRPIIPLVFYALQSDIDAGSANTLPAGSSIFIIDTNGIPTGSEYKATGSSAPTEGSVGIKNNLAAIIAPTINNDSSQGYSTGSRWIDTVGEESYICIKSTVGTAVWSKSTVGTIQEIVGLQTSLDTKVDKITNKGLSTNDYTTTEQTKLAGIATGATAISSLADITTRSHTLLTDIGTNAHSVIDTHIADATIHFTVASIAHSSLANLSYATAGHTGFEPTVTKGNLTAGSSKVSIGGTGTGALIGAGASVDIVEANLTLSNIGGAVTDAQVPNTITLSNLTQITTRSHASLQNLTTTDDHTQYALLAGRVGGQTIYGGPTGGPTGDDLKLMSYRDIFIQSTRDTHITSTIDMFIQSSTGIYLSAGTTLIYASSPIFQITNKLGIGTSNPTISGTGKLHMVADTFRLDTSRTPATAGATGNTGEWCWDGSYVYICTAANTWHRAAHNTW